MGERMSGECCSICGISGTSTKRCCGNNPEYRINQINNEIQRLKEEILYLKNELMELENE